MGVHFHLGHPFVCDGLVVFNCVLIAVDDLGGFVHVRVGYTYGVHFLRFSIVC